MYFVCTTFKVQSLTTNSVTQPNDYYIVPSSTAVALNPADGTVTASFGMMQGTVAGAPVTTEDCQYVLATHNVDGSKGFFSVFEFSDPSAPALTYEHPFIDNEPFGAVGYYWSPVQGNFPGGELNTNDVFIWSFDTNLNLNNASVGTPQFFGFQLPTNPLSTLNVTLIDGNRDYQAKTAPVITDEGLSMYWSVSRSKVYGWVGDGSGRTDFTTNGVNNFGFTRDTMPFSSAASTTPSLSNSTGPEGFVVGTSASNEIWVWDRNFTDTPIVVPTAALVTSRLLVSPDDVFVYFATPAPDSSLYQVSSADLAQTWKLTLSGGIVGDIAQTKNGARIIVADSAGAVTAFSVATADEGLSPVSAPPVAPTTPTAVAPTAPTAVAVPVVSGPPATPAPSETSGPTNTIAPSNTMGPSTSPAPATVSMPTVPTLPTPGGSPVRPTTPTSPTSTGTPPAAPSSDAMTLTTTFISMLIIATTSICMMA